MQRLRTELHDLVELVLLPGLAAVLPWGLCFGIFKRLARLPSLYRKPCDEALRQARNLGWSGDNEAHWIWVRRLVTLVDHADHYLGLWRSDRWMQKNLVVQGVWPAADKSVMLFTFHWGAGYWGLRHAASQGLRPHALVASLGSEAYQGRTVMSWYAKSRNAHVARTLGSPVIDASHQIKQVIKTLREQQVLLGVVDVPADAATTSMSVSVLALEARVPQGLFRLAVTHKVPVTVYITGLDTNTGKRSLRIRQLVPHNTIEDLALDVFKELDKIIAEEAPAWHFWGISNRFFAD